MSINITTVIAFVFIIGPAAATPVHAAEDGDETNAVAVVSAISTIQRHAAGWAEPQPLASTEAALWQFPGRSRRVQRPRCESKKKGALIGAAIGGVAGAAVAVYVIRGSGAVLGTASGAKRYLAYWTAGGASGGALAGFAYCR